MMLQSSETVKESIKRGLLIMKLDLYFEGLMQSWRGAERGITGDAPGKSALVGMIGRCMGVLREDVEALKKIDDSFTITDTFAFETTDTHEIVKKESITGIKRLVDDQVDYHGRMVQKEYLEDAKIGVTIEGEKEALMEIREAFLHPVWPPYLGSSCCPPSGPIIRGDVY